MKICVIGAGYSGLTAAKDCLRSGREVVVFEIAKSVVGTWIYTARIGKYDFGLGIHTSMYRGLK